MTGKPKSASVETPPASGHVLRLIDQARLSAAESDLLNPSTLLVVLSLYRAYGVLDRKSAEEMAPTKLTRLQWNALAVLYRTRDQTSMGELAEMMAIQQTNLSGIVKGLCKKGVVKQTLSRHDKRSRLVSITKKGAQFFSALLPTHWANLERLMSGLSESDRETLVKLLDQLVSSIKQHDIAPLDKRHKVLPGRPEDQERAGGRSADGESRAQNG